MNTSTGAVQLLNSKSEHLGNIDFPKAVRMLFRKVAVVVDGDESRMLGPHPWPRIVQLVREVVRDAAEAWWLNRPAAWHRGGVFIRDNHRCAYCGVKGATTLDHIFPRSRGGRWEWLNIVAACLACNGEKRDRTPEEAGMPLLWQPYVPTRGELLNGRAVA